MGSVEAGNRHWPGYGVSASASGPFQRRDEDVKEPRVAINAENTSRESLPSVGYLDLESSNRDGSPHQKFPMTTGLRVSTSRLQSPPTAPYPGHPPYSYPSSAPNSAHPGTSSSYVSPTSQRRIEEEREQRQPNPSQPAPQRQSLPSIHEALGNDNPLPYPPSASGPPKPGHSPAANLPVPRPSGEGPSGPPNPFSSNQASAPYLRDNPFAAHQPSQGGAGHPEAQRSSLISIHSQDSRNQSAPSLSSGKSPTQSSRNGAPSITNSQTSGYELSNAGPAGTMSSPTGYGPYPPQPAVCANQPQGQPPMQYQHGPYEERPPLGHHWNPSDAARAEEVQRGVRPNGIGAHHTESVKRHLEGYDVEASLNELAEISCRTLDFSRVYAARAHQSNRSGPMLGSLPSLAEVDDMLALQRRSADAFTTIRNAILSHEHALASQAAEQRAQRHPYNPDRPYDEHVSMYQEEFKGGGGFAGGDAKKRRGKAAPPGRCHSCNRAETPEWRRGPDGARTLCNACGLHYAKLTRKLGANKALSSNLRPKSGFDSRSPPRP